MSELAERVKHVARGARTRLARPRRGRAESPALSICAITGGRPQQVRPLLEAWRPFADELFLAIDERGPVDEILAACAGLPDRVVVLPGVTNMERYLGWVHEHCTGEWILRVDDDELPSRALGQELRGLVEEREITHFWLPRAWPHPTPAEKIVDGAWGRDIQVRLVRNVPGLWRFSGLDHSNIEVDGASRVLDAPLLHVNLLLRDLEDRRRRADAYERARPGMTDDLGVPLNDIFLPENHPEIRRVPLERADVATVERFLEQSRAAAVTAPAANGEVRPAERLSSPSLAEVERWLGHREVPSSAYHARVRLVHGIEPMKAEGVQHIQVEVTNLGDTWWPRGPEPRPEIVVGHCWRRTDGTLVGPPTLRTPFTESVAPGATTRLTVPIIAPSETGELEVLVDVVHEWVRWFDDAAIHRVTVMPPYDEEFFIGTGTGSRQSADAVLPALFELVPTRSVVDVGCGLGTWLAAARDLGVDDLLGIDGDWVDTQRLQISPTRFRAADLAAPLDVGRPFDLALSLEVAEHLPEEAASTFVASLAAAAPVVAFSAAVPGQGGNGHVNEQWPAYWTRLFAEHGYVPVDALRSRLWDDPQIEWWYAQNLIVYASHQGLEAHPALRDHPSRGHTPLALVHPRRITGDGEGGEEDVPSRVSRLDTSLFATIETETTENDRRSLLALHDAVGVRGQFRYLEIGSHLGGSLQALVADPRCITAISIDTRPASQPDDRGEIFHYEDNSTQRMLDLLRQVPGADLSKLRTFEAGTDVLTPADLPGTPTLCLIDGEHTHEAALRDAYFCLEAIGDRGIIAFHDSNIVQEAIDEFVRSLGDRPHTAFQLPDSVAVVQVGAVDLPGRHQVAHLMAEVRALSG